MKNTTKKEPEVVVKNMTGKEIPKEVKDAVNRIVADIKSGKFQGKAGVFPVHGVVHDKQKPLDAKNITKFQKMFTDIATQKKDGFIFICETKKTKEGKIKTDGVSYGNGSDRTTALQVVIDGLDMNAMEVLDVLLRK